MKKFENLGRSLSKQEQKAILGGYDDPGWNCHTKSGCTNTSNNGEFYGRCPSAPDLPAGCSCENHTCPGS